MVPAILEELWHTISHNPMHIIIELVQFAILIFIIKAIAFGVGSKRGIIPNSLEARQSRIRNDLERAVEQETQSAEAPARVQAILEAAQRERETVLEGARREAERERERIASEQAEEIAELERQAEETLAHEREEVLGSVRDSLVDVVTAATRNVLDEGFTPARQRSMIQNAILASVDDLENVTLQ
jgi:F-type H+-transporting ATPase subunit b